MARIGAALMLLGAMAVHAQTPTTATIRGRVVAADTGLPIAFARVALVSTSSTKSPPDPVFSDSDGRFQLTGLNAGRYSVSATKTGYLTASFGAHTPFDRSVDVVVQQTGAIDRIDFQLVKSAAISGRIVDDLGDPAVGATVTASRVLRVDGSSRLTRVKSTTTDDLGEYRLGGLPAGRFIVSVGGGGGAATRWNPGFFPGTPSLSSAVPIAVSAGDEVGTRDFIATPAGSSTTKMANVSGVLVDAQGGAASGTVALSLVSDLLEARFGVSGGVRPGGEFSFAVGPGDYVLAARGPAGQGTPPLRLTIGEADISGLRLALASGGTISGRLIFDGAAPPKASAVQIETWSPDVDADTQSLLAGPPSPNGPRPGVVFDGDTFSVSGLFGDRELRVRTAPPGWAVKAITLGRQDIEDVPIAFENGRVVTGVEIVLTDHPAQLSGGVIDADGKPVGDYSVVLFPEDRVRVRHPSRAARWVRADQTGRFSIDGLRGGSYLVIAVDRVDAAAWADHEYLDRLRPRATRVTLGDGEKKVTTLTRIVSP